MDWPAPLTVREVSAELRCSEDEVRALIRDGELLYRFVPAEPETPSTDTRITARTP